MPRKGRFMRKAKEEIIVCDYCQIPLVWTFHWAYYEYYCLNCGGHWGMLGAGERVELTSVLRSQSRQFRKLWRSMARCLNPESKYTRDGCNKCSEERDHRLHLSAKEKREHKVAVRILNNLKGAWSPI